MKIKTHNIRANSLIQENNMCSDGYGPYGALTGVSDVTETIPISQPHMQALTHTLTHLLLAIVSTQIDKGAKPVTVFEFSLRWENPSF